jgi:histidine ammonia-lyase
VDAVALTGTGLAVEDVERVAIGRAPATLAPEAVAKIDDARALIDRAVESGTPTYGVNTGFGRFVDVAISSEDTGRLQLNLLRSHACGVGDPFPTEVVRGAMLLRANALATGASGVRRETVELLLAMLNAGVHPVVPSRGSLGASGDLAPLAHLALPLVGEGEAELDGDAFCYTHLRAHET